LAAALLVGFCSGFDGFAFGINDAADGISDDDGHGSNQ
jgi:hypothetical protein